jgi:general secretion pathway protein F
VGRIRLAAGGARAAAAIAALLSSGVPIAAALRYGARAAGDAALERRLAAARDGVIGGERLSAALARTHAGSAGLVQLVRAGEATGDLAPMLAHAARLDAEFAEARVRALVRAIEPTLILLFGAIVALIAAALLQAVYSVRPLG